MVGYSMCPVRKGVLKSTMACWGELMHTQTLMQTLRKSCIVWLLTIQRICHHKFCLSVCVWTEKPSVPSQTNGSGQAHKLTTFRRGMFVEEFPAWVNKICLASFCRPTTEWQKAENNFADLKKWTFHLPLPLYNSSLKLWASILPSHQHIT